MSSIQRVFRAAYVLAALLAAAAPRTADAQAVVPAGFEDTLVVAVPNPTALAAIADGRILIASQGGQLYVHRQGATALALDLGSRVCLYRERGLLGVAVDPEFASNHFIYIAYIFNKHGNCEQEGSGSPVGRVSRLTLNDDGTIDPAGERVLLDNIPSPAGVHNLDDVEFGKDGYLYVSVGDGGCDYAGGGCFDSNDAARDMNALVGKVLRITRDGGIPAGNPFTGPGSVRCATVGVVQPGLQCQEIFATGLRNPWRLAFDPNATGTRFFINDVGQDTWEEINEGMAGADYGWNAREGFCAAGSTTDCASTPPSGLANPVFAYGREDGCASVTGGAFVPNGAWPSALSGAYLFSDFVCGTIFTLKPGPGGSFTRETFLSGLGDSSATDLYFGPSELGTALYYTTYGNGGEVRRIAYVGGANRTPTASLTASPLFGQPPLTVAFDGRGSSDPDGDALTYEWSFGDGSSSSGGAVASHTYTQDGTFTASLRVADPDGAASTASVRIDAGNTPPDAAIVTPTADQRFAVGDLVVLRGRATDAEDGDLPSSSLRWVVLLHHNTHTHGFLPPTTGNDITFRAPGPENLEAAATSYLEVQLTATDSHGRSTVLTQSLMPRTARMDFLASPPGAPLRVDNAVVSTPASFNSWVGFGVSVEAAPYVASDGTPMAFSAWDDGGAAARTIVTPDATSAYTATFRPSTAGSTPFHGMPAPLPGTLQAEDFDSGGEGVAYHDNSPGNAGGEYRPTSNVDIATAGDTEGQYTLGWVGTGEWLNYSVSVASAGVYDIDVRVASTGAGGTFHIEVNAVDVTGPLTVPDTGGWQTWQTVRKSGVSLAAGPQVWRLVMDTRGDSGAVGNFNYLRVTAGAGGGSTPFHGSPIALPGIVQAEDFDSGGEGIAYHDTTAGNAGGEYRPTSNVDIARASDTGGGYTLGWVRAGEWLNYSVTVGATGTYDVEVRVASAHAGGTFHIEVNGADATGPLSVPATGDWQAWTTIRRPGIHLDAGPQTWRLVMDTNGATGIGNINFIGVSAAAGGGGSGSTPFHGTPIALPGTVQAEDFDSGGEGVAYHDTTEGNLGGEYRPTSNVDIAVASDSGGGYTLGWVRAGEWLKYSVDVGAAGTYAIEVRVASASAGGTFHIEANGVDVTGPLTVAGTGDWQSWTTIRKTGVQLAAGPQVWRLVMDANGATGIGNFNHLRVAPSAGGTGGSTPFAGSPVPLPGTIQAEDFDFGGEGVAYHDTTAGNAGGVYRPTTNVDIADAFDTGGGYTVGWTKAGEWLHYSVTVAAAGAYDIEARVAALGAGGSFHLEVNGVDVTGPLLIPDTGDWQSWVTIRKTGVQLAAGPQVWRVVLDTEGSSRAVGNLNSFRVTASSPASILRGPYLQDVSDSTATVVWTTRDPGSPEVRYAPSGGGTATASAQSRHFPAAETGLASDVYQHEARLVGLAAGTRYTYDVFMAGRDVTPGQDAMTTAPAPGSGAVRFIAFGDSGVGSTAQRQLAARIAADSFDVAIHTGDVAYGTPQMVGGGSYLQYEQWMFDIYAPWLRSRAFFPAIGNHDDEVDHGRPYRDVFVLPENGVSATYPDHAERYYSFDYGPVHFVALDTEFAFQEPARRQAQLAWLEADLSATNQPWRVVYLHRPPYSAGLGHGSDLEVRDAFVPLFERYGVQLVIAAHDHIYERTHPLRGYVPGGTAVTYVVSGGGGAELYPVGAAAWTAVAASAHHYVRATADECTLDLEAVRVDGAILDTHALNRCF